MLPNAYSEKRTPSMPLTDAQTEVLLRPIRPQRVLERDGNKYLEAYDVRAHLNRVFGFGGWSGEVVESHLLFEDIVQATKDGKPIERVTVGYRVRYRLTILDGGGYNLAVYTEEATGDAINFPRVKRADAHDFAVKTAESQALKRCAINLGDQFGLSLYGKKPFDALVKALVTDADSVAVDDVDAVTPESHPVTPEEWRNTLSLAGDIEAVDALWDQAVEEGWAADPVVELAFKAHRLTLA